MYQNPIYPVKQRIDDLLSRMTLEEKVGQMNMPCVYLSEFGREVPVKMERCRKFAEGKYLEGLAIGSTWNMDLVKKIYSIAAMEARAVGINQLFTLVIEPGTFEVIVGSS